MKSFALAAAFLAYTVSSADAAHSAASSGARALKKGKGPKSTKAPKGSNSAEPVEPECTNIVKGNFPTDLADLATSTPVPDADCGFDDKTGYQSATDGKQCFIRGSDGEPLEIDYTQKRYTKYTFTAAFEEAGNIPVRDNNLNAGWFIPCNRDYTTAIPSQAARDNKSPEFYFLDREPDIGYSLQWGGWGSGGDETTPVTRILSGTVYPDIPREWEIIMEWNGNDSTYRIVSWKVDGVEFSDFISENSDCPVSGAYLGHAVRIGSLATGTAGSPVSTIKVKDFEYSQADRFDDLC